jgi:hypothetical protein
VHDIEKGNTNGILKSICPTMKKKEKIVKIFENYGALILFYVLRAPYYQGGALGELVKCKSLKTFPNQSSQKNQIYPSF